MIQIKTFIRKKMPHKHFPYSERPRTFVKNHNTTSLEIISQETVSNDMGSGQKHNAWPCCIYPSQLIHWICNWEIEKVRNIRMSDKNEPTLDRRLYWCLHLFFDTFTWIHLCRNLPIGCWISLTLSFIYHNY